MLQLGRRILSPTRTKQHLAPGAVRTHPAIMKRDVLGTKLIIRKASEGQQGIPLPSHTPHHGEPDHPPLSRREVSFVLRSV